tara:strand:+ start:2760 stop:3386 length:627 start_codon:yes stop_codon:yes gene_type:complete
MCVAILKPRGVSIDVETLNDAWDTNSDGGGFAFAKNGKLQVFKSLDKKIFIDALIESMQSVDTDYMIHMRIATSGITDMMQNCHPFAISKTMVFCHNGVIRNVDSTNEISDTRYFNKHILQQMNFDIDNNSHLRLIESFIEDGNKLIFMHQNGTWKIANENLGSWQNGIWFSNLNHSCELTGYEWVNDGLTWKTYKKKMQNDDAKKSI